MWGRENKMAEELAELQLVLMKAQIRHMEALRALEIRKAQVELDTAEALNLAAKRVLESQELPPIKLS